MSKFFKPPVYSKKALENQWINFIYQSHDLICGCPEPIHHLKHILKDKWPRTADAGTSTDPQNGDAEDDFPLNAGDLDQLFTTEKENEG